MLSNVIVKFTDVIKLLMVRQSKQDCEAFQKDRWESRL